MNHRNDILSGDDDVAPRKKKTAPKPLPQTHGVIEGAGSVVEQEIDHTLETNYMPYVMSVILSRAILRHERNFIPCPAGDRRV